MPDRSRCLKSLWGAADIVLKVRPPDMHEVEFSPEGGTLISFYPAKQLYLSNWQRVKATVLAMDAVMPPAVPEDGCPKFDGKHRWLSRRD